MQIRLHTQDDPSVNQEVLELFNILTDTNFKNLFSIFEDVCKVKRDLNSFINTGKFTDLFYDNYHDYNYYDIYYDNQTSPIYITNASLSL